MNNLLVVISSVCAAQKLGRLYLDRKSVDGLKQYAAEWDGPVKCIMREGDASDIVFGAEYEQAELPFTIDIVSQGVINASYLEDAAIVLASGDNYLDYLLPHQTTAPVVFVVENPLKTRLQILKIENGISMRLVKSALWSINSEFQRRRAFRKAASLQCNGQPAYDSYSSLTRMALLFFDTRTSESSQIDIPSLARKQATVLEGRPLRIAFSGRLDPIKGVTHLVPIFENLRKRGVPATLDIYGEGSSRQTIENAVRATKLNGLITLHGPVDFDTELLPALKERTDLFLCCHRQSDPSCTYLETLGCGVPIVGYGNAAFTGVLALGKVGMSVPIDDINGAASAIAQLSQNRQMLSSMMDSAATVGREHSFEKEFAARVRHLAEVVAFHAGRSIIISRML